MASLVRYGTGKRLCYGVQFASVDGLKRHTLRLGKVGEPGAKTCKAHVEELLAARIANRTAAPDTVRWLSGVPVKLYDRIAAFGLVDARPEADATVMKLGEWLADYTARHTDIKPSTTENLRRGSDLLLAHFSAETPIDSITPSHAMDWRRYLLGRGYAETTVRLWARVAKAIFNDGVERELISKNPFRKLPSSSPAAMRERYITPAETDRLLEACPSLAWKVVFGLARLAGLRTPSETHAMEWSDIVWDRGTLNVRVPKLERFPGKDRRLVPIVPKLMTILEQAFAEAPEGQVRIVTLKPNSVQTGLETIIQRAGLNRWPRLWQTLRQSCQTQWDQQHGIFVSSQWIGHSVDVAAKHYSMVSDEVWSRATRGDVKSDVAGVENGAKSDGATPCEETQPVPEVLVTSQPCTVSHCDAQVRVAIAHSRGHGADDEYHLPGPAIVRADRTPCRAAPSPTIFGVLPPVVRRSGDASRSGC